MQASGGSYGFCAQELEMGSRKAMGRLMQRKKRRRTEKEGEGEEIHAEKLEIEEGKEGE